MNPKRRARFPSRGGIANGRRRPAGENTLVERARALQRRKRAAMEMGFMEGEATDLVHAIPLRGKHVRAPIHWRDGIAASRVKNEKNGMEFPTLATAWDARIRRFQRTLPKNDPSHAFSHERAAFVLADTIRFFGRSYPLDVAEQIALSYLSGANIQQPRVPKDLAAERRSLRPLFERLIGFIKGRNYQLHELRNLQRDAKLLKYRLAKNHR